MGLPDTPLTAPSAVAANLACVLILLRDRPGARDEQVAAFRLLLASMADGALDLRVTVGGLRVNDSAIPETVPGAVALRSQLLTHGVGEVRTPAGLDPAVMLDLLRALASRRGHFRSVYELANHVNGASAGVVVAPPAPEDAEAAGDWSVYEPIGGDDDAEPTVEMSGFRSLDTEADGQLEALLDSIERHPDGRGVPDKLNEVVAFADAAVAQERWSDLLRAAQSLVNSEEKAGNASFGRAYSIALRRMLPRSVLEQLARMVTSPRRARVLPILRRMGADATEVLLALLASASTIDERRAYYGALRQMTAGTELLVNMLTHDDWFVIRNVADLCGELRIEPAVSRLAHHLGHEDERVRRSVAGALAKIGTAPTIEPLRQAMRDSSPTVRLQAVQGLDGRKSRGLAMTLSVLLDEEKNPDITREMLLALGRIGTSEAVQALVRAAAPGGRLFSRKPVAVRLGAIEGLREAGTAAASTSLQSLLNDEDTEVRAAAQKALAQLNG